MRRILPRRRAAARKVRRSAPPWRWWLMPAAVVLAVCFVVYWTWLGLDIRRNVVIALGDLAVVAGGLLAWGRRPDSTVGPLLLAWGTYGLVGGAGGVENPVLLLVWFCASPFYWILLAHVLLTYPDGRVRTRAERWFLRVAYATPLLWLAIAAFAETAWLIGCRPEDCPTNLVLIHPSTAVVNVLNLIVRPSVGAVLGVWLLVLIGFRRHRMTPSQQRSAMPVLWASVGPLGNFLYAAGLGAAGFFTRVPAALFDVYHWGNPIVAFWVPVALVVGLYTSKLARADVATLLVQLRSAPVGELQTGLIKVLRDPTLRIVRPDIVEAGGLPAPGEPQVITEISGGVLLVHHPSAREEDPELFDAAIAAAAVTLDNARLTARVQAQLAEATASRERLVHAADEERGRVERDLHDGAQQQLIGVGMALESARLAIPDHSTAAQLLDEASGQLRASIAELRALARGLRPALLAERGIEAALNELRRRVPMPVSLRVEVPGRLDLAAETAAYFVVAEALQNATKHAPGAGVEVRVRHHDGELLISVRDDGPGGADQRRGSGLRGLSDRVAAVGGLLTVASAVGEGTVVSARLPAHTLGR